MKNVIIFSAVILGAFLLGRATKPVQTVNVMYHDTLPPIVRIDTVRDTLLVPKYVQVERFDTIRDTVDGNPIYLPVPISSYLFTDDSTYLIDMEGYNVKARSIEVYPRTIKRWGIGVSAGGALTPHGVQPYIGVGVQYNLILW